MKNFKMFGTTYSVQGRTITIEMKKRSSFTRSMTYEKVKRKIFSDQHICLFFRFFFSVHVKVSSWNVFAGQTEYAATLLLQLAV